MTIAVLCIIAFLVMLTQMDAELLQE